MASKITKKLEELGRKAAADGHWPLAAAAHAALADEANLDHQINVLGAIHEAGQLRNRMEPFWEAWRTDVAAWTRRCAERLRAGDRDYWAVVGFLALDIREVWPVLKQAGYAIKSVRAVAEFMPAHYATLSLTKEAGAQLWSPVLELGWNAKSGEVVDAARIRAILFDEVAKEGESHVGKGNGTNFVRAGLPHGSWRMANMDFELVKEAVVLLAKTVLKKA